MPTFESKEKNMLIKKKNKTGKIQKNRVCKHGPTCEEERRSSFLRTLFLENQYIFSI